MLVKIKTLLHASAAITIFFLTDSFCSEVVGMLFRVCDSIFFVLALYICLDILNVWTAVFLYSKYVLRTPLSEMYLGKPLPVLRWCAVAVAVPFVIDAVYFIFTKGEFKIGCRTPDDLAYILFHEIFSSGFRAAVTEAMLFRGMLLCVLQKGFGKKAGAFVSSFFYVAVSFIFYNSFETPLLTFLMTFLIGLAFVLITCETGSVWSSAAIHFLYNAFSSGAYILHIDTRQNFPAVFTYTVKSGSIFFTDLPLPAIIIFLTLIIMTLIILKKRDGNNDDDLHQSKRR